MVCQIIQGVKCITNLKSIYPKQSLERLIEYLLLTRWNMQKAILLHQCSEIVPEVDLVVVHTILEDCNWTSHKAIMYLTSIQETLPSTPNATTGGCMGITGGRCSFTPHSTDSSSGISIST
eukprot:UN24244